MVDAIIEALFPGPTVTFGEGQYRRRPVEEYRWGSSAGGYEGYLKPEETLRRLPWVFFARTYIDSHSPGRIPADLRSSRARRCANRSVLNVEPGTDGRFSIRPN